jgi:hypothetical protein
MGNGPYNGSHRRLPGGHCDSPWRMKFANPHRVIRGQNVCFWHKADIAERDSHVRFWG